MMTISLVIWGRGCPYRGGPHIYSSYTGIGNMTSSIDSHAFHGGTIRVAFDRDGFVGLHSRQNHKYMIEHCNHQLSMVSAAIWCRFSVDKIASRCFLYAPPLCPVKNTFWDCISALVEVAAKNRSLRPKYGEPPLE